MGTDQSPLAAATAPRLPARYEGLTLLGRGGMGEVYRARDRVLGRTVALKVVRGDRVDRPGYLRRFRREVEALGLVRHPGIVTVYAYEEFEGVEFYAMEHLAGEPLDEAVRRRGRSPRWLVDGARQVADALAALHGAGLVHRDLKPSNLMVLDGGRVKVLDFGLAGFSDPGDRTQLTATGQVLGTFKYMPPEMLLGNEADARGDLYQLGLVLYEALTGVLPLAPLARCGVDAGQGAGALPAPPSTLAPGLDRALDRCLLRLLAREPAARHASAAELRDELAAWLAADAARGAEPAARGSSPASRGPAAAAPPTEGPAFDDGRRVRRGLALAAAGLLAALGALGALALRPPDAPPERTPPAPAAPGLAMEALRAVGGERPDVPAGLALAARLRQLRPVGAGDELRRGLARARERARADLTSGDPDRAQEAALRAALALCVSEAATPAGAEAGLCAEARELRRALLAAPPEALRGEGFRALTAVTMALRARLAGAGAAREDLVATASLLLRDPALTGEARRVAASSVAGLVGPEGAPGPDADARSYLGLCRRGVRDDRGLRTWQALQAAAAEGTPGVGAAATSEEAARAVEAGLARIAVLRAAVTGAWLCGDVEDPATNSMADASADELLTTGQAALDAAATRLCAAGLEPPPWWLGAADVALETLLGAAAATTQARAPVDLLSREARGPGEYLEGKLLRAAMSWTALLRAARLESLGARWAHFVPSPTGDRVAAQALVAVVAEGEGRRDEALEQLRRRLDRARHLLHLPDDRDFLHALGRRILDGRERSDVAARFRELQTVCDVRWPMLERAGQGALARAERRWARTVADALDEVALRPAQGAPAWLVEARAFGARAAAATTGPASPAEPAEPRLASPAAAPPTERSFGLSRACFQEASCGWRWPVRDRVHRLTAGDRLEVGGRVYQRGLFAHAPSSYVVDLGGAWRRLRVGFGIQRGMTGSVTFAVLGDGRELFSSPVVRPASPGEATVDVAGVRILELRAADGGDGTASDWGVWVDPVLER